MKLSEYLKNMDQEQQKLLARELLLFIQGRPSAALRMQEENGIIPKDFFELGKKLKESNNKITESECLSELLAFK